MQMKQGATPSAVIGKIRELLAAGVADRVMGWQRGDFLYDHSPAVLREDRLSELVYDLFCGGNLCKHLLREGKQAEKIIALLKPCDTYSFNQLVKEHRLSRDNVHVLALECPEMLDMEKIRALGIKGIESVEAGEDTLVFHTLVGPRTCKREEVLLEKCLSCKSKQHVVADDTLTLEEMGWPAPALRQADRFLGVRELEAMTPEARFAFWREALSRCIRCNACRNACPSCTCEQCVFDNPHSGIAAKANTDPSEENLFHLVRSFHVAGRCTDCGECSRVCPQRIPLHLLNRKIIADLNGLYGEYQAGEADSGDSPLTRFDYEDAEPGIVSDKGGAT